MYLRRKQIHHALLFLLTAGLVIGTILFLSKPVHTLLGSVPNPADWKKSDRMVFRGVPTFWQNNMKLQMFSELKSVKLGILGDHTSRFAAAEHFDHAPVSGFYNYSFGSLTLPEIRDIMQFVSKQGHMPNVMIINVENPRMHGGSLLFKYRTPLPKKLFLSSDKLADALDYARVKTLATYFSKDIKTRLDWKSVLSSVTNQSDSLVVMNPEDCHPARLAKLQAASPGKLSWLPKTVRPLIVSNKADMVAKVCRSGDLNGIARDGRVVGFPKPSSPNTLNWPERGSLQPEHINEVGESMRDIDRAVSRVGSTVVFLIQPLVSKNQDVPLNRLMDQILEKNSDLHIVDMRYHASAFDLSYFYDNGEHPNGKFYRVVANKMREKGLWP